MSQNDIQRVNELLDSIDLEKLMKQAFWGGFDTYEDYVLYGDLFPYKIDEPSPKKQAARPTSDAAKEIHIGPTS